jgi:hypothetical protein
MTMKSACDEKFTTGICFKCPAELIPMSITATFIFGAMIGATEKEVGDKQRIEKSALRRVLVSVMQRAASVLSASETATTNLGHCFPDQSHQRSRRIGT